MNSRVIWLFFVVALVFFAYGMLIPFLLSMLIFSIFVVIHWYGRGQGRSHDVINFLEQNAETEAVSLPATEKDYATGICEVDTARAVMAVLVDARGILFYRSGPYGYRIRWARVAYLRRQALISVDKNERVYCTLMGPKPEMNPNPGLGLDETQYDEQQNKHPCLIIPWKKHFDVHIPLSLRDTFC